MVTFVLLDSIEGDEPVLADFHDRQNGPGIAVGGRAFNLPAPDRRCARQARRVWRNGQAGVSRHADGPGFQFKRRSSPFRERDRRQSKATRAIIDFLGTAP